jgi:hypothetical protein
MAILHLAISDYPYDDPGEDKQTRHSLNGGKVIHWLEEGSCRQKNGCRDTARPTRGAYSDVASLTDSHP